MIKAILIGNPNCGKTTLFNALTKSSEKVGNFIGVTVKTAKGFAYSDGEKIEITDFPGIYSVYTSLPGGETALKFLKESDGIVINVLDSTNLKRSLSLTSELVLEGFRMICVLSMSDLAEKSKIIINTSELEKIYGCRFIKTSAVKNKGFPELLSRLIHFEENRHFKISDIKSFSLLAYERSVKGKESVNSTLSADKILLDKKFSFPIFFIVLFGILIITFGAPGMILTQECERLFGKVYLILKSGLASAGCGAATTSLIADGAFSGVCRVLCFLPQMTLVFFFLSLLEDCGYMARVSFLFDKIMRYFSQSGDSAAFSVMALGCTVPAVTYTELIPNSEERKIAVRFLSFIPCSAKIPVFLFLPSLYFGEKSLFIVAFLYLLSVAAAFLISKFFCKTENKEIFILEMPRYRIPVFKSLIIHTYLKIRDLIKKIFTVLFLSSILIWILSSFNEKLMYTSDIEGSLLSYIGKMMLPFMKLIGIKDFRMCVSLLSGIVSKESILSSLSVLYKGGEIFKGVSIESAVSYLCFVALYVPCVSALSAIKAACGTKEMIKNILLHIFAAFSVSSIVFYTFSLFN